MQTPGWVDRADRTWPRSPGAASEEERPIPKKTFCTASFHTLIHYIHHPTRTHNMPQRFYSDTCGNGDTFFIVNATIASNKTPIYRESIHVLHFANEYTECMSHDPTNCTVTFSNSVEENIQKYIWEHVTCHGLLKLVDELPCKRVIVFTSSPHAL